MIKKDSIKILKERIEELHNTPYFALRLEVNNFWLWFNKEYLKEKSCTKV